MNYTNQRKTLERLKREYLTHGSLVVAFDFDNTVFDFHSSGLDMESTVNELKRAHANGLDLFAFTANEDHVFVRNFVFENLGIEDVPININHLDHLFASRKPFYSILLDDRAGLASAQETLKDLNDWLESDKIIS